MIVLMLADNRNTVERPSISDNGDGNLTLCEDGLGREDSKSVWYRCPVCHKWLFYSHNLNWAGEDGYWRGPGYTLTNPCYNNETEIITCPDCEWTAKLEFFSYMG